SVCAARSATIETAAPRSAPCAEWVTGSWRSGSPRADPSARFGKKSPHIATKERPNVSRAGTAASHRRADEPIARKPHREGDRRRNPRGERERMRPRIERQQRE